MLQLQNTPSQDVLIAEGSCAHVGDLSSRRCVCTLPLSAIADVSYSVCPVGSGPTKAGNENVGHAGPWLLHQSFSSGGSSQDRCEAAHNPRPQSIGAQTNAPVGEDWDAAVSMPMDGCRIVGVNVRSEFDEWLDNAVAVGSFDLPPIPFATLPETQTGLPSTDSVNDASQRSKGVQRGTACTAWRLPLCEYDTSNCQMHQAIDTPLPPLPPSSSWLPRRTHRELRMEEVPAAESKGTPLPHVVILWVTTAGPTSAPDQSKVSRVRGQKGTPLLISLASEADAAMLHQALRVRSCVGSGAASSTQRYNAAVT